MLVLLTFWQQSACAFLGALCLHLVSGCQTSGQKAYLQGLFDLIEKRLQLAGTCGRYASMNVWKNCKGMR